MSRVGPVIATIALLALPACGLSGAPPGMALHPQPPREHQGRPDLVELARIDLPDGRRPLLVVYPRTACSGSASTVLIDEEGRFVGAVPPGSAALVSIRRSTTSIVAVSSVEVSAPAGAVLYSDHVRVPPLPAGLLLRSTRFSARECGSGQYADVLAASKSMLETAIAEAEIQWLDLRVAEGQAWLEAHRPRVAEVMSASQPNMRPGR